MTWEYRIIEYADAEAGVAIHEVTYDDAGRISGWSGAHNGPPGIVGYNLDDLRLAVEAIRLALTKPPLKCSDIVAAVKEAAARDLDILDLE